MGWCNIFGESFSRASSHLIFNFTDEISIGSSLSNSLVVYGGSVGDKGVQSAHIVLPLPLPFEEDSLYINSKGVISETRVALTPGQHVRTEWSFFSAFNIYALKNGLFGIDKLFVSSNFGSFNLVQV